jgi:hypothetical protein
VFLTFDARSKGAQNGAGTWGRTGVGFSRMRGIGAGPGRVPWLGVSASGGRAARPPGRSRSIPGSRGEVAVLGRNRAENRTKVPPRGAGRTKLPPRRSELACRPARWQWCAYFVARWQFWDEIGPKIARKCHLAALNPPSTRANPPSTRANPPSTRPQPAPTPPPTRRTPRNQAFFRPGKSLSLNSWP